MKRKFRFSIRVRIAILNLILFACTLLLSVLNYQSFADLENKVAHIQNVDPGVAADTLQITHHAQQLTWTVGSIAFLTAVLIIVVFLRTVLKPMKKVNEQMHEIAECDGDLTKRVHFDTNDEIGDLARSFNLMTENLRHLIQQVSESAEQVAASATELNMSADQTKTATEQIASSMQGIAAGTDNQARSVEEGVRAIQELSSSVQSIASTAHEVTNTSQHATELSLQGNQRIQSAVSQMMSINDTIGGLSESVKELGSRSEAIG